MFFNSQYYLEEECPPTLFLRRYLDASLTEASIYIHAFADLHLSVNVQRFIDIYIKISQMYAVIIFNYERKMSFL